MYTEEEQLDQIRQWWRQRGKLIIIGLLIVIVGTGGWRYWHSYRARTAQEASILFDHLLVSYDNKDLTAMQGQGNYLLSDYANSIYAEMGALILAKQAVDQNDLADARKRLQWILDNGRDPGMRQLARIHLARIQLSEKQYKAATATLATVELSTYLGWVEGLRGDIAIAQGDVDAARTAYQTALTKMSNNADLRFLYQAKLDQLPRVAGSPSVATDKM